MKSEILTKEEVKLIIPDRIPDSHKGTYGKVALLGGAIEYSGAIRLASMALAALKSGAGLSTVAVPRYLVPLIIGNILEVMIYPIDSSEDEIRFDKENIDGLINKVDVLACGMGLGKSKGAHEIIYYIIRNFTGKLVLDADALNILSEDINILNEAKCQIVLTPHMMEFKRLYIASFGETAWVNGIVGASSTSPEDYVRASSTSPKDYVRASSTSPHVEQVIKFVEKYDVTLLLKGPTTIVGASSTSPEIQIKLVTRGTPGMSTAGSGDVLSGILAGFLGYMPNAYDATCAAAFINGLAGELAARDEGEISMTAGDTVRHITEAIRSIGK